MINLTADIHGTRARVILRLSRTWHKEDAEDAVAEACLSAFKRKEPFEDLMHLSNYLFKIAIQRLYEGGRQIRKRGQAVIRLDSVAEAIDERTEGEFDRALTAANSIHLTDCLSRLSELQKAEIAKSFEEELPGADIGLCATGATARQRKRAALVALRKCLNDKGFQYPFEF